MRQSKFLTCAIVALTMLFFSFTNPGEEALLAGQSQKTVLIDGKPVMITYVGYLTYDTEYRLNVFANTATGKVAGIEIQGMIPADYNFYPDDIINNPQDYLTSPRRITGLNVYDTSIGDIILAGSPTIALTYP